MDAAKIMASSIFDRPFQTAAVRVLKHLGIDSIRPRHIADFSEYFGNVIRVNQPIADEQRIPFHGFRMLENDGFQFAVLDVHHACEIVGERAFVAGIRQMQFQPFPAVGDGTRDTGCHFELCAGQ